MFCGLAYYGIVTRLAPTGRTRIANPGFALGFAEKRNPASLGFPFGRALSNNAGSHVECAVRYLAAPNLRTGIELLCFRHVESLAVRVPMF